MTDQNERLPQNAFPVYEVQSMDGPASPLFWPIHLGVGIPRRADALVGRGVSEAMAAALQHTMGCPQGLPHAQDTACADGVGGFWVAWGIPFKSNELIVLTDQPSESPGAASARVIEAPLSPLTARWLVFMHTSDLRPKPPSPGGFISPMRGEGQLGELAATYHVVYANGTELQLPIRRRHQIGLFTRRWGENCFQAVAHTKPYPIQAVGMKRTSAEQPEPTWGWSQTRVDSADSGAWVNWLWAWENPRPTEAIIGLRFEPGYGAIVLCGLAAGEASELPFRWRPRRKALLTLPEGEIFAPDLNAQGLLAQIQLDLGQVISATPRLLYLNERWSEADNTKSPVDKKPHTDHQFPDRSTQQVLVEYTAHPDARLHLADGTIVPVAQIEEPRGTEGTVATGGYVCEPVAAATQRVRLRVVARRSNTPIAVRLHVHGEHGEYLAPEDRHRLPNPFWFEDYSVDFLRCGTHASAYINGETMIRLPLGKVYIEVTKGFESRPVRQVVDVSLETQEIGLELEKVLPWREAGWVTADTHVHFLSPVSALLEAAAEGVNVINLLASQWGELMTNVGDFDGRTTWGTKEAGGDGEYLVRVGTENRQHVLGHISLLGYRGRIISPMTVGGPDEAALGDPVDVLLTEWARQCKAQGGLVVLPHFPNPRAEHAASIVYGDIDALEMTSWSDPYSGIDPYSLADWYRYLNCGYLVAAVGGTDKMDAMTAVGTVRTYAHLGRDEPFTYDAWLEAVRRAETFVTYGPLLDLAVEGRPMGSRLHLASSGGTVDVAWRAASVTTPMSRVELIVNGEIRESVAVAPWEAAGSWRVPVPRSAWMALLVRGRSPNLHRQRPPLDAAGKPEMIAAHSSPVLITVEGSPLLAAADAVTILEQIEGAMAYLDTIGPRRDDITYKRMRLLLEGAYRALHNRMHAQGLFHPHDFDGPHTK